MRVLFRRLKSWLHRNDQPEKVAVPVLGPVVEQEQDDPEPLVLPTPDDVNTQVLSFLYETELETERVVFKPKGFVADLLRSLRNPAVRKKSVPRVPVVFPQLLRSLRDPDSTAKDFVRLIERDPMIASGVLRTVNSAYYNPEGKQIESFHRAVVILGIRGMRTVVSSAVMQPIIDKRPGDFPRFSEFMWDHAVHTGMICQQLAQKARLDPLVAYLAGLVHDIGAITLTNMISRGVKETGSTVTAPQVISAVDMFAGDLSCLIAGDWGLPPSVVDALNDQRRTSPKSPMGKLLTDAHFLSELYLLHQKGLVERGVAEQACESVEAPKRLYLRLDDEVSMAQAA